MAIGIASQARGLTREQRYAFAASFLGWAMDAFDYFLIVFQEIAHDLHSSLIKVQLAAINLPLQTRLADHYGQSFGLGMAIVIVPVLVLTALVTWLGPENRGAQLGRISAPEHRRPAPAAPVGGPDSRSP